VGPDGHLSGRTSLFDLAEQTRRDNMATFPDFTSLDDVPRLGVSVGLGTIMTLSRAVAMVLVGAAKRASAARILAVADFDPAWPATFIHRCPQPRILLDAAAAGSMRPRPARLDAEG
jgi:glucosamine-6-phosphate deaminase